MGVSHQKGWVRLRGRKWHGCFRRTELDPKTKEPKLVTHSFVLGLKSEFSKSEAREKLEDEIAKLGGRATGDQVPINGSATFGWFVKNRYSLRRASVVVIIWIKELGRASSRSNLA